MGYELFESFMIESDKTIDNIINDSQHNKNFGDKCQNMPTIVGSKYCLKCNYRSSISFRINKLICLYD